MFTVVLVIMSVLTTFMIRVICGIEAGAFKYHTRRIEHAPYVVAALGAHGQRVIGHFLPRLEAVATGLAKILVRWHVPITSYMLLGVLSSL